MQLSLGFSNYTKNCREPRARKKPPIEPHSQRSNERPKKESPSTTTPSSTDEPWYNQGAALCESSSFGRSVYLEALTVAFEEPLHQKGDHGKNNYPGVRFRKKLDGLSLPTWKWNSRSSRWRCCFVNLLQTLPYAFTHWVQRGCYLPYNSANVSPSGKDNSSDSEPIFSEYFFTLSKSCMLFSLSVISFLSRASSPSRSATLASVASLSEGKRFCHWLLLQAQILVL